MGAVLLSLMRLFFSRLPSPSISPQRQRLDKLALSLHPSIPPSVSPSAGPRGAFCLTRLDICFLKSIVCLKRTSLTICFRGWYTHTHTHTCTPPHFTVMLRWSYNPNICRGSPSANPQVLVICPAVFSVSVWLISKSVWHMEGIRVSAREMLICVGVCVCEYL